MSSNEDFDIFVSYAHADDVDGHVSNLVSAMSEIWQTQIPGRKLRLFFDTQGIGIGDDWNERILKSLRASRIFLAFTSPAYVRSEYCRKEWLAWCAHERARGWSGKLIQPVFVENIPDFSVESEDIFIRGMATRQHAQLTRDIAGAEVGAAQAATFAVAQATANLLDALQKSAESPTNIAPLHASFTGREKELGEIRRILSQDAENKIPIFCAIAGAGKTDTAVAYARDFAGEYPGGRFLVPATHMNDYREALVHLAEDQAPNFADSTAGLSAEAKAQRAWQWLATEAAGRVLLIFDNITAPESLHAYSRAASALAPDRVHVVGTTRLSPSLFGGRCAAMVHGPLSDDDALSLLGIYDAKRKGREEAVPGLGIDEKDRTTLLEIARTLNGHAMSLDVAGAFLSMRPTLQYREYLQSLSTDIVSGLDQAGSTLGDGRARTVSNVIAQGLEELSQEARESLLAASLMESDKIVLPWLGAHAEALQEGSGKLGNVWRDEIYPLLSSFRLLEEPDANGITSMQRLARELIRKQVDSETLRRHIQTLCDVGRGQAMMWEDPDDATNVTRIRCAASSVANWLLVPEWREHCLNLALHLAQQLTDKSQQHALVGTLLSRAIAVCDELWPNYDGGDDRRLWRYTMMFVVSARAAYQTGRFEEAETLATTMHDRLEKLRHRYPNSFAVKDCRAGLFSSLATLMENKGDYTKALFYRRRQTELAEELLTEQWTDAKTYLFREYAGALMGLVAVMETLDLDKNEQRECYKKAFEALEEAKRRNSNSGHLLYDYWNTIIRGGDRFPDLFTEALRAAAQEYFSTVSSQVNSPALQRWIQAMQALGTIDAIAETEGLEAVKERLAVNIPELERGLEANPDDIHAHQSYCELLLELADSLLTRLPDEAGTLAERALAISASVRNRAPGPKQKILHVQALAVVGIVFDAIDPERSYNALHEARKEIDALYAEVAILGQEQREDVFAEKIFTQRCLVLQLLLKRNSSDGHEDDSLAIGSDLFTAIEEYSKTASFPDKAFEPLAWAVFLLSREAREREAFAEAEHYFQTLLQFLDKLSGEALQDLVDNGVFLRCLVIYFFDLLAASRFAEVLQLGTKILQFIASEEDCELVVNRTLVLSRMGIAARDLNKFMEAHKYFTAAMPLVTIWLREWGDESAEYEEILILRGLGDVSWFLGLEEEAAGNLRQALDRLAKLEKKIGRLPDYYIEMRKECKRVLAEIGSALAPKKKGLFSWFS